MPIEKESALQRVIRTIRECWPGMRDAIADYSSEAKENPAILVQLLAKPAVRYSLIALGLVIVVLSVQGIAGFFSPAPPKQAATPLEDTVVFHVLCTNPNCQGHHFAIQREKDFDDFPVRCPKCGLETGYQARRIMTGPHKGQWEAMNQ